MLQWRTISDKIRRYFRPQNQDNECVAEPESVEACTLNRALSEYPECEMAYRTNDVLSEIILRTDRLMEEKRLYLNHDITLDIVAKEVWSNRTYLSRAISTKKQQTFRQYVNDCRLAYAAEVLYDKGYDIQDIAIASGFKSARMFCNALQQSSLSALDSLKKQTLKDIEFICINSNWLIKFNLQIDCRSVTS